MTHSIRRRTAGSLVLILMVALGLLLLSGCNEDDVERSMGRQTASAVKQEYGTCQDPVLNQWVNTLGHRLVGESRRQNISYSFTIVNTDMVNAFAAPWGYIFVTRGMLDFVQSEDELAFVMGHEVGHVVNRDAIKSVKHNLIFSLGTVLLGSHSESLGNMSGLGAGLLLLHYSRGDEQNADICGSTFSYAAGYDPDGGVAFFQRLMAKIDKDHPSRVEHLFLTHPPTPSRIAAEKARPEMNLKDPVVAAHIGRGYARRYEYATATSFYKLALKDKPDAVQTRLCLADALAHQGLYAQARREYQALLQQQPENTFAAAALASLPQKEKLALPAQKPSERTVAATALDKVPQVDKQVDSLVNDTVRFVRTSAKETTPASDIARQSISSLMGLADSQADLSDRAQEIFVVGNGAVSEANESAFTLEALNQDIARVAGMLKREQPTLKSGLQEAAAGCGASGDVAAYNQAMAEMERAATDLGQAIDASDSSYPLVQRAAGAGKDTVSALSNMVRNKQPDRFIYPVRVAAQEARRDADAAQAKVGEARQITLRAEARAILAQLNLAALNANPATRLAYDGMVARYCCVEPSVVTHLRSRGLGYGDVAFILMAARATNTNLDTFLPTVGSDAVIDHLQSEGISFEGPVVLLRLLARAIQKEQKARG